MNKYKILFHFQPQPTQSQFNSMLKHLTQKEFRKVIQFTQTSNQSNKQNKQQSYQNPKCIEYCLMRTLRSQFYQKYNLNETVNQPNEYGKYDIIDGYQIHYNWSHDDLVSFIEGPKEVGIDIFNCQRFEGKSFSLVYDNIKGFLTVNEQQQIESINSNNTNTNDYDSTIDNEINAYLKECMGYGIEEYIPCNQFDDTETIQKQRIELFGRIWSCKEAFVKTIGIGLNDIISTFDIDLQTEISHLETNRFDTNCEYTIDISKWFNSVQQYHEKNVYLYCVLIDKKYFCAFGLYDKIDSIVFEMKDLFR